MASDLVRRYQELRAAGSGHQVALRALARELAVDAGTVERTLRRAQAEDRRAA